MPWQGHAVLNRYVPRFSSSSHLSQKITSCIHSASCRLHSKKLSPKPVLLIAAQQKKHVRVQQRWLGLESHVINPQLLASSNNSNQNSGSSGSENPEAEALISRCATQAKYM